MTDFLMRQHRELLARNIDNIETRLRLLADKIAAEKERIQHVPGPGNSNFTDIFCGIQNEINWALSNMRVPQYISNAAWADMEIAALNAKRETE